MIKKHLLLLFVLLTMLSNLQAQIPKFDWGSGFGGKANDKMNDFIIDSKGNAICVGTFAYTLNLNPTGAPADTVSSYPNGLGQDVFIAKYDTAGKLIWKYAIGNSGTDYILNVRVDSLDNIFTYGQFRDSINLDPINNALWVNANNKQINSYVAKYTQDFKIIWGQSFGIKSSNFSLVANNLEVDMFGNSYVCGKFKDTLAFNKNKKNYHELIAIGADDIFIAKFNPLGAICWVKGIVGKSASNPELTNLSLLGRTAFYIGGNFSGSLDLDLSSNTANINSNQQTSKTATDFFIAKYDTAGNYIWAKAVGGAESENLTNIQADTKGNVYVTGKYMKLADFNPDSLKQDTIRSTFIKSGKYYSVDVFIAKYTSTGEYNWVGSIGGAGNESCSEIEVSKNGKIYLTGYFSGIDADFNPSTLPNDTNNFTPFGSTKTDAFILSLTSEGVFNWASKIGGSGDDFGIQVREGLKNSLYYSVGSQSSIVDLDMSVFGNTSYTRPILSGTTIDILFAKHSSCYVNATITATGYTLTANEASPAASYQWLDCATMTDISGANSKSYTTSKNGQFACRITLNNCTETSECVTATTVDVYTNKATKFSIYPNPTSNEITANASYNENFIQEKISIIDLIGNEVLAKKIVTKPNETSVTIDISNLSSGVYFVKLQNEIRKFIKN